MRVAVIGAGWAGLAAAVELSAAGCPVTLIEAGRVAGGRARGVTLDGRPLDNGQHILLGAYRDTLALMRRVGADPQTLLRRLPLRVCDNRGFDLRLPRLPAPLHVAAGLLGARGVPFSEKWRTAWWMRGIEASGFRLPADLTVAEWLDAAGQHGILRRQLWEPLCLAALNTPAERASAQIFAHVLRDSLGSGRRADTDLLLPAAPLDALLPTPAVRWLQAHGGEVRFGQRVRRLVPSAKAVAVDGEPFAAAILAVAPQHLPALWPAAPVPTAFEPIATVYLAYPAGCRLPFPLYSLQGGLGQWVVDRGAGLLAAVLSGDGDWAALDDASLVAALHGELAEVLGRPAWPAWHRVIREKRATFRCQPGLDRAACRTASPRLLLAGDHSWAEYPATLEGAVRSGLRAARQWLATAPEHPGQR